MSYGFVGGQGISERDQNAYRHYQEFCRRLGIKPASSEQYFKTTAPISPGVIGWTGTQ